LYRLPQVFQIGNEPGGLVPNWRLALYLSLLGDRQLPFYPDKTGVDSQK
jgi:hypothetical protein